MKTSEIRNHVEKRFWDEGRHITKNFVGSMSKALLHYCTNNAKEGPYGWTATLYDILYGQPKCKSCGTSDMKFRNFRDGYLTYCSSKCAGADKSVDEKRKQTNLERHGVARPQQELPEIRRKFKATMKKRYGVFYGGQSEELQEKAKQTLLDRYGVDHPYKSEEIRQKTKNTMLERYGVENIMQCREHFERQQLSGFKALPFRIAGKTFKLRGSEHHAVRWFVDMRIDPKHILTTSAEGVPSIPWVDSFGKNHVYHPDAYVKYKGKWYLVEVKSTFTLGLLQHATGGRSGKYSQVRRKAKACADAGFRFKLLVIASSKSKKPYVAQINDLANKTKRQVKEELKLLHPGKFRQL